MSSLLGLLGRPFWAYHRSFSPICPLIHLLRQALWFSHDLIMHLCMPVVLFSIWLLENSYSLLNEQLKCHFLSTAIPDHTLWHNFSLISIYVPLLQHRSCHIILIFFMPLSPFLRLWLPSYSFLYPLQSTYFYKINKWEN